jgi:hypothetical protein
MALFVEKWIIVVAKNKDFARDDDLRCLWQTVKSRLAGKKRQEM